MSQVEDEGQAETIRTLVEILLIWSSSIGKKRHACWHALGLQCVTDFTFDGCEDQFTQIISIEKILLYLTDNFMIK